MKSQSVKTVGQLYKVDTDLKPTGKEKSRKVALRAGKKRIKK